MNKSKFVKLKNPEWKNRNIKNCDFNADGIFEGIANDIQLKYLLKFGAKDITNKVEIEEKPIEKFDTKKGGK